MKNERSSEAPAIRIPMISTGLVPNLSEKPPAIIEQNAIMNMLREYAAEAVERFQANSSIRGFRNTPKRKLRPEKSPMRTKAEAMKIHCLGENKCSLCSKCVFPRNKPKGLIKWL